MRRAVIGYAALALVLSPSSGAREAPEDTWHAWVRLEAGALMLVTGGQEAGYARLAPALVLDGDEDWGLHLGAPILLQPWGEAVVGWDGERLGEVLQRHLHLSVGAEVFDWGRVDVDGRLAVQLSERRLEVVASGLARGLGQPQARLMYSAEVRWRFARPLYALAQGGTRLSPGAEGTLRPGTFVSLGLGVDHAR